MKNILKSLLLLSLIMTTCRVEGQILNPGEKIPAGAIVYSLPITTIHLVVEAEHQSFIAGPYARFAQKYLGVEAKTESGEYYKIKSIEMIPYIEADPSLNISLNLGNQRHASANFLEMINQGLIIWSDSYAGKEQKMYYPQLKSEEIFAKSVSAPNLANESSTLYRTVQTESGTERVAVRQSQTVERSLESKAEEVASQIFNLRAKRLNIITGDTDATFSGDAMRAAIEEINRLEDEYLALFFGKVKEDVQRASFDVIPVKNNERQIYIAFRISELVGLLPAGNLSGRPIVLELITEAGSTEYSLGGATTKDAVLYRKPVMVNARLMDGQELLLQSRLPIYQLGTLLSFPINIATGRL